VVYLWGEIGTATEPINGVKYDFANKRFLSPARAPALSSQELAWQTLWRRPPTRSVSDDVHIISVQIGYVFQLAVRR
jgi:hypothetical protein